jgi:hypothetical protein
MNYKNAFRFLISAAAIVCVMGVLALTVSAQGKSEAKDSAATKKSSGRDPFTRYQPIVKAPKACGGQEGRTFNPGAHRSLSRSERPPPPPLISRRRNRRLRFC